MHDLKLLANFFQQDVERLLEAIRCEKFNSQLVNPSTLRSLEVGLLNQHFSMTHRALVGHFKLLEDRVSFSAYCDALSEADTRNHILDTYPVLRRRIDTYGECWRINTSTLLRRLRDDAEAIGARFWGGAACPPLKAIEVGAGDAHDGGASVCILTFSDDRKIVYKPRGLGTDAAFARLAEWMGQACQIDLKTPHLIDRSSYGWVEFVEHAECASENDALMFYRRSGILLFLVYILEGSDFHYENLIACGSHPVLVDLEAFFHPGQSEAPQERTVLRTGLLPSRYRLNDDESPDVSGLSNAAGQQGLASQISLSTDPQGRLVFKREKGRLVGGRNVPHRNGEPLEMNASYVKCLKEGFSAAYRNAIEHRTKLIKYIDEFRQTTVRFILRHTAAYTHLLEEARHPALMLSDQRLSNHFALLQPHASDVGRQIVEYEMHCLQQLDIPLFSVEPGERHLRFGDKKIENFFATSGFDIVIENIRELSGADLDRQIWTIDQAFKQKAPPEAPRIDLFTNQGPVRPTLSTRLENIARDIADDVVGSMYQDENFASWIVTRAASLDGSEQMLTPSTYDLYAGMPGEILFLTHMANRQQGAWSLASEKAYRYFIRDLRQRTSHIEALGLFTGWGGIIAFLSRMAALTGEELFDIEVQEILRTVDFQRLIARDQDLTLIKGAAGLIAALADYHRSTGSAQAIDIAIAAGEHLLKNRWSDGVGDSWRIVSAKPLSGMAHGASGFAASFAKLFQATRMEVFRAASLRALEYERTLFVPGSGNWLDLRDYTVARHGNVCATTWAHGAPGIGLARLCLLECGIDNNLIREELDIAVQTTLAYGNQGSPTLVSGFLGSLELPLRYSEQIDSRHWPATLTAVEGMVDDLEAKLPSLLGRVSPFGLMVGITGIGYQCLRIARSGLEPSLLALSDTPPRSPLRLKP